MSSIQSSIVKFMLRRSNMWNKPLEEIRKTMEAIKVKGMPEGIEVSRQNLNGVDCDVFTNTVKKKSKTILYFHGGGFCLGIYASNRAFVAQISQMTGMDIFMPDYRLAPEHPFPAALEDAISAYRGLVETGLAANDVIVMGDSSGCALAVSALLILKQSGQEMPCKMAFITPVFDLAGSGESFRSKADKDPFRLTDPLGIAKIYVAENNPTSPSISPLYGDLAGLPPIVIHAAEQDAFLSDSTRFAEKADKAGVIVNIKVLEGMWHIFHMQAPFVPESTKALQELCEN